MSPLPDLPLAALADVARGLVFALFLASAGLLTVVILLQEGKGGGLGSAFGGAAADAFGVKAGTVNRFTAWLGAAFLGLALLHAGLSTRGPRLALAPEEPPAASPGAGERPAEPAPAEAPPGAPAGG